MTQARRPFVDIRPARFPDELPAVRALLVEYAASLDVDLCFQSFDDELATLPGSYAAPDGGLWLATVDDEAAGCVALRPLAPDACEMKRLYVRPAWRATGLGRQLVESSLVEATKLGHARICLDTLPSMRSAIALYRTLGFEDVAPYCHNPVPGALFLARALPFVPEVAT